MSLQKNILNRIIWLFPLVVAAPLGLDICIPGTTTIANALGSAPGMTQWLISGFILCLSLGQLVFGPLVDRYSSQFVFCFGGVLYIAGSVLVYFSNDIAMLIGFRLIQGIGASATAVSVFACVPRLFSGPMIGKVFSLFNGVISLVPVLAPIIGGALIVRYGWEASFYFLAVFVSVCFIVVMFKPLPKEQATETLQVGAVFSGYLRVIRHAEFRLGCIAASCGFASQLIFFSSSPIVIIGQFGIPVDAFGFYFAVNAVAITSGSMLVSHVLGKVKEPTILLVGAACLLLAASAFYVVRYFELVSVWGYIIPATIGSFGFALLMGAGASVALSPFKKLAGTASALLAAAQMTFSSLVAWFVIQLWSPDWTVMIVSYYVLAAGIVIAERSYRRHDRQHCVQEARHLKSDSPEV